MKPQFSICVAVRDRASFLVNAVQSVLTSDFSDFELVIVDDGSVHPVSKTLAAAGIIEPRVRVIEQRPTGIAAARNTALEAAVGDYITVLDSDDELVPDALSRLAQLVKDPTVSWVYADYEELVGGSRTVIRLPEYQTAAQLQRAVLSRPRLPFKHSGMTMRADVLRQVGGYNEQLPIKVDVELMLRALAGGVEPQHLRYPVVRFRRHDSNVSRDRLAGLKVWLELIDTYGPPNPLRRAAIKAVRTGSELGKWLVSTVR